MKRPAGWWIVPIVIVFAAASSPAADSLVCQSGDLTFTVTADGLTSARLGDRVVADGGMRAFDASAIFFAGAGPVRQPALREKSLEVVSPTHARVRQSDGDLSAVFDYSFDGPDVHIKARIDNNSAGDFRAVGLQGPVCHFAKAPEGIINCWHITYTQAVGVRICHPSHWDRIGGAYATDGTFGVGLSPENTGLARTLFLWNWVPQGSAPPDRSWQYIVPQVDPAGGAITIQMTFRLAPTGDWKQLLAPYKWHFDATAGALKYQPDQRPFVQFTSVDKSFVTADNPLGFSGDYRRMDKPEGVEKYCRMVLPVLKEVHGQGVMFWALQGYNPRGAMYRPDFDIFPKSVEDNLPALRKSLSDAGLRMGLCARPGEIVVAADRDSDTTVPLDPDDADQLKMMVNRFQHARKLGFDAFYLDSFGLSLQDVKAMAVYRRILGRDVPTYAEQATDWMLPLSGAYLEIDLDKKSGQYEISNLPGGMRTWDIYRWLVPQASSFTVIRVAREDAIKEQSPAVFGFEHGLTPCIQDWRIHDEGAGPEFGPLVEKYLDANWLWK